jgi:hypothetical protein
LFAFILFYFLSGNEEEGKKLLAYGTKSMEIFFVFISLAAKKKFKESATLIETAIEEGLNGSRKKIHKQTKLLKSYVLPLLALVHKRIADTASCDTEKTKHLKTAFWC